MSAFRFSKTEKATAIFNTSNDDLRKKLKFPEYYTSIKPVDNVDPVDPSGNQKVLVGDASTVNGNNGNGKRSWISKVWEVIRKDFHVDKFSNVSKTQEVKDLNNLSAVLSQLCAASQVYAEDAKEFFSHENSLNQLLLSKMTICITPSQILQMSLLPYHQLMYLFHFLDLMFLLWMDQLLFIW